MAVLWIAGACLTPVVLAAALLVAVAPDRDPGEAVVAARPLTAAGTDQRPVPDTIPLPPAPSVTLTITPPRTPVPPAPDVARPPAVRTLSLGVVVPTTGALAAEGREVVEVLRRGVASANAAGGTAGKPVELLVAPAEDGAAVASIRGRVSAMVGGFGILGVDGLPWLLPADPSIRGRGIVAAEPGPEEVGALLGAQARQDGIDGPVGVVIGGGPDAAMAAGLASEVKVVKTSAAPGSGCKAEIGSLRNAGAVALAVAGGAELAAACLKAAAADSWAPRFGVLLLPSAAYAHLEQLPACSLIRTLLSLLPPRLGGLVAGVRTVLGLPWPTAPDPGATRFLTTTATSYRALVSFAALELALEVARTHGELSLDAVASWGWKSDLLDVAGGSNRNRHVVSALSSGWMPL